MHLKLNKLNLVQTDSTTSTVETLLRFNCVTKYKYVILSKVRRIVRFQTRSWLFDILHIFFSQLCEDVP